MIINRHPREREDPADGENKNLFFLNQRINVKPSPCFIGALVIPFSNEFQEFLLVLFGASGVVIATVTSVAARSDV